VYATLHWEAIKLNWLNPFVGGCVESSSDDSTAIGDKVVIIIIMMTLSTVTMRISLFFTSGRLLFVVRGFTWVWIGLSWVSYLVSWVGCGSMKWAHGQL